MKQINRCLAHVVCLQDHHLTVHMNEYEWAKHIQKETCMEKWYVIQVRSKAEEKIRRSCEMLISKEILKECFIPKNKRMKKIKGNWIEIEEILFTGYVFLVSDDPDKLYLELKKVPDLTKMLGHVDGEIFPLYDDEVEFLKSLSDCEHVVEISTGLIENDEVRIVSGPLKGREGIIRKIDRHKRVALIEVELFGKTTQAKVGLEIVSKT